MYSSSIASRPVEVNEVTYAETVSLTFNVAFLVPKSSLESILHTNESFLTFKIHFKFIFYLLIFKLINIYFLHIIKP